MVSSKRTWPKGTALDDADFELKDGFIRKSTSGGASGISDSITRLSPCRKLLGENPYGVLDAVPILATEVRACGVPVCHVESCPMDDKISRR